MGIARSWTGAFGERLSDSDVYRRVEMEDKKVTNDCNACCTLLCTTDSDTFVKETLPSSVHCKLYFFALEEPHPPTITPSSQETRRGVLGTQPHQRLNLGARLKAPEVDPVQDARPLLADASSSRYCCRLRRTWRPHKRESNQQQLPLLPLRFKEAFFVSVSHTVGTTNSKKPAATKYN